MAFHPYDPEDKDELDAYSGELDAVERALEEQRVLAQLWREACHRLSGDIRTALMLDRKPFGHVDSMLLLKILDKQAYRCWNTGAELNFTSLSFEIRGQQIHITNGCNVALNR